MRSRLPVLVVGLALLGACTGSASSEATTATTSGSMPTTTTTTPTTTTTSLPTTTTTNVTTTTSAPTTTATTPTTTTPTTTTTTSARSPQIVFRSDGTLLALPVLDAAVRLPAAGLASEVRWEQVDAMWILLEIDHAGPRPFEHLGLYLLGPDDRLYLLGRVPEEMRLEDWSPDGRYVLFRSQEGHAVLDLYGREPMATLAAPGLAEDASSASSSASFTRPTGRDAMINSFDPSGSSSVTVFRRDGSVFSALYTGAARASALYHLDGTTVVLATADRVWLVSNTGTPIRDLAAPGTGCELVRWWTEDSVLVTCDVPGYENSCGPLRLPGRSLWDVPVDGGEALPIGPDQPAPWSDDRPDTTCDDTQPITFTDAVSFGGSLYVVKEPCRYCNWLGLNLTVWPATGAPVVRYDGSFPFRALVEPRARGVVALFESHVNFAYQGLNLGIVFPDGSTEPIGLLHEGQGAFVVGAIGHP